MFRKSLLLIASAVTLLVASASIAAAGGWAVVTLDSIPTNVVVAQPIKVGMMIRQHGKSPWVFDRVRVRGYHPTGETFVVGAEMDSKGHYTADLVFNKAGKWDWAVSSGLMPEWQPMPELEVLDPSQLESMMVNNIQATTNMSSLPSGAALESMLPSLALLSLGVLGLIGSTAGLVVWWRGRK